MKAIVFGAGKIARGFIGHLLYLNHIPFTLVDVNPNLVHLLNEQPFYHVHVMGNAERSGVVRDYTAISLADSAAIASHWAEASIAFVSVGGKNLPSLAAVMAEAFQLRCSLKPVDSPVHIIMCENWKAPADLLRDEMRSRLSGAVLEAFDRWVGIAESAVMRSGVEPTSAMLAEDPLCVRVSDYWQLPVDKEALPGEPVAIEGLTYIEGFGCFLERKFYTYNSANGTVSYLGYLRGYEALYDAATDPEIVQVLEGVYAETSAALANKYDVPLQEQEAFAGTSRRKLQDRNIEDLIERNARDPIRKLGPDDRLIGSARLVQQYGGTPRHLALAIAAALYYDHPGDPIAQELKQLRIERGIHWILREICQLAPEDPLNEAILQSIDTLRQREWIS